LIPSRSSIGKEQPGLLRVSDRPSVDVRHVLAPW
jgi:hypothetical protein